MTSPEGDVNYGGTVLACVLGNRLSEANYLFTQVRIPYTTSGSYDFARLDAALAQSVDLVVATSYPQFYSRLARHKVPYAVFGEFNRLPASAVGGTQLDHNLAMPDFAAACAAEGVKEVVQISLHPTLDDATAALRAVGVRVRKVSVEVDESKGALIGVKRAGMETFRRLLAEGRLRRGSACYISDDYLADGALMALALAGLRAPEDIRIVTFANKRLGPIYVRDLTRMEYDASHAGEVLADAVLEYLKSGKYPANSLVGPQWIHVGGKVDSNQYSWNGDLFAIRTYSTPPTDAQVTYNYKIDRNRFGLPNKTFTWSGTDGFFATNGNWSVGLAAAGVPGAEDAAALPDGSYTVTLDDEWVVDSLSVGAGATLALTLPKDGNGDNGAVPLTVLGALTADSGAGWRLIRRSSTRHTAWKRRRSSNAASIRLPRCRRSPAASTQPSARIARAFPPTAGASFTPLLHQKHS